MKKTFLVIILLAFINHHTFSWGQTGHRVVGLIADKHITRKAKKSVEKILKYESIAQVSNFMDFIKSDETYRHMNPWHYCTIPDNLTYEEAGIPPEGDIIQTIDRLIRELKTKNFTDKDEAFALKCLIHLVGDLHQPLHVGNGIDKGGNDVKVQYFWRDSNLHRVWDSGIIDGQNYSYSEYADWIDKAGEKEISEWQKTNVIDWALESKAIRTQAYEIPQSKKLSYKYNYKNLDIVNKRLLQAGIRLAGIINEIYN